MNAAPRDLIRSTRFRQEREADWRKLETIVSRAERQGVAALDFDSALQLAELYRWMADLLEQEEGSAEPAQAYRDTARWLAGVDVSHEVVPPGCDRPAVIHPPAWVPVFNGVECDDLAGVG